MEIFVKKLVGKQLTIEVEPADAIADVKRQLYAKEGIAPEEQCLVFGNQQLEDNATISDYAIDAGSSVYLLVRPAGSVQISVELLTTEATPINLEVECSETVAHVKTRIEELRGIASEQQCLLFEGEQLEDDRSLSEYNICAEDTLQLRVVVGLPEDA